MQSDTIEFLFQNLARLRPGLRNRDPEWQELERLQRELETQVRGACGGDGPALSLLLDLEDAWARAAACSDRASFLLGIQIGIDLGRINFLREE